MKRALVIMALLALAGCSTNKAKDINSSGATLTGDGKCLAEETATWWYQLRNNSEGQSFRDVGPAHTYTCNGATGVVPISEHRVSGLADGDIYEYRIRARFNGADQFYDASETDGRTEYDWFYTPQVLGAESSTTSEIWATTDPETGVALAGAAGNCGRPKEKARDATQKSLVGLNLWHTHMMVAWKFCNGQITKMYTADVSSRVTDFGGTFGWHARTPEKVRAYSTGGNPEHAVYTYRFGFYRIIPFKGVGIQVQNKDWCSTIQISGSGAAFTHGSCSIQNWG